MRKQIQIMLESVEEVSTSQTFDKGPGRVGEGPWTVQTSRVYYEVTKLRNAVAFDWCGIKIKLGTRLTERDAQHLAESKEWDVIVRQQGRSGE